MQKEILHYFFKPHNIWFEIIRTIRDLIKGYNLTSLIFRDNITIPFLSECGDRSFSRCTIIIHSMHVDLRIIFQSGNEKIILDSFYYFLTTLTGNNFTMGRDLGLEKINHNQLYTINFIGEEILWTELAVLVDEIIAYFIKIKSTYCLFATQTQLYECVDILIKSLLYKKKLIEKIIIDHVKSLIDNNIEYSVKNYELKEFDNLIFIPDRSLCFLFNNVYLEYNAQINQPIKSHTIYHIDFEEIKLITM